MIDCLPFKKDMGSNSRVDLSDFLRKLVGFQHRCYKFTHCIFHYVWKTAIVNGAILKRSDMTLKEKKRYGVRTFRDNLIVQLLHDGAGRHPQDELSYKLHKR